MNFFYKETKKKQLHYFRAGKTGKAPSFSATNNTDFNDVVSSDAKKVFRFSILILDLFILNFLLLLFLQLDRFFHHRSTSPFGFLCSVV